MQVIKQEGNDVRVYKNGDAFRFESIEEFKDFLSKYNFDISKINLSDMVKRVEGGLYFDKYYVQLDSENKKIYQIGITNGVENFDSYYEDIHLKVSSSELLENVMTFTEASKKWGLNDSTLRKLVATEKLEEGIDYRKSGNTWLITREAMEKVYGNLT